MQIFIESKRRKIENIKKDYPFAKILDVTSNAETEYKQFSPFYPVGDIPVPGMPDKKAVCVEAIWQALKVFENYGYDTSYFEKYHKNIKRTVRKFGKVKGHFYQSRLLSYVEAREKIYLPAYRFVLEHKLSTLVEQIRQLSTQKDIVFLDYTKNDIITETKTPLSHAAIIRASVLNDYTILKTGYNKKISSQGKLF